MPPIDEMEEEDYVKGPCRQIVPACAFFSIASGYRIYDRRRVWITMDNRHCGFHDIRHSVARYLDDIQKVGLKKVQQVLRHRRQSTTEIYVDGNYTDTKEAVRLLELQNLEKL